MSRDKCLTCCWYARRLRLLTHFKFSCLSLSLSLWDFQSHCKCFITHICSFFSSLVGVFVMSTIPHEIDKNGISTSFSFCMHSTFHLNQMNKFLVAIFRGKILYSILFKIKSHQGLGAWISLSFWTLQEVEFLKYAWCRSNGRYGCPIWVNFIWNYRCFFFFIRIDRINEIRQSSSTLFDGVY